MVWVGSRIIDFLSGKLEIVVLVLVFYRGKNDFWRFSDWFKVMVSYIVVELEVLIGRYVFFLLNYVNLLGFVSKFIIVILKRASFLLTFGVFFCFRD